MKAVTANRLTDGRVVYRAGDGSWVERLDEAAIYVDEAANPGSEAVAGVFKAAEAALEAALRDVLVVVGPYLIEIDETGPSGRKRVRETIRTAGPSAGTTRPDTIPADAIALEANPRAGAPRSANEV